MKDAFQGARDACAFVGLLCLLGAFVAACSAPTVPTQSDSLCVSTVPLAFSAGAVAAMDRQDLEMVATFNRVRKAKCH